MEFLDSFGAPLHRYEGIGTLSFKRGHRPRRRDVSFEVRQLHHGQIVVGWISRRPFDMEGADAIRGLIHQVAGRIIVTGLMPFESQWRMPGINSGAAFAREAVVEGPLAVAVKPRKLEFSLVNFTTERWSLRTSPIRIGFQDYSLRLAPVEGYPYAAKKLRQASGIEATAHCVVRRADGRPISPSKAVDVLDSVCHALSLAGGTKVSWLNYTSDSEIWGHRSAVTKPYSNLVSGLRWGLDEREIIRRWAELGRDNRSYLGAMTDYFLDATARGPYLETRALTAASVLDALTNRHCEGHGFDVMVDDPTWQGARNALRKAIRGACRSLGITTKLTAQVNSLRRHPYEQKLRRLLGDLGLPTTRIAEIVEVRDRMVHYGGFPPAIDRVRAYHLLAHTSFAVLARLSGYRRRIVGP